VLYHHAEVDPVFRCCI